MRGVLFEISKAFHEIWHNGLLFKLHASGVEDELLALLNPKSNRGQRLVLNGQMHGEI